MKRFLLIFALIASSSLTSCFVAVENQIIPDETVDRRLVGPWVGIPLFDTEEEAAAAAKEGSPRLDDDIGCNGYFIVGETDGEQLEILNIEQFSEDGAMIFRGRNAKTRAHKGRNFLLFELEKEAPSPDEEREENKQYVMEYQIKDDGTLWLWFLYIDSLSDIAEAHSQKVTVEDKPFGQAIIHGSSEEILDFYSNPAVLKHLASAGRYQKLKVPQNARILFNSPALKEAPTQPSDPNPK